MLRGVGFGKWNNIWFYQEFVLDTGGMYAAPTWTEDGKATGRGEIYLARPSDTRHSMFSRIG